MVRNFIAKALGKLPGSEPCLLEVLDGIEESPPRLVFVIMISGASHALIPLSCEVGPIVLLGIPLELFVIPKSYVLVLV